MGQDGERVILPKDQEWEWVLGGPRNRHCPSTGTEVTWMGQKAGSSWTKVCARDNCLWGRGRRKEFACGEVNTERLLSESTGVPP